MWGRRSVGGTQDRTSRTGNVLKRLRDWVIGAIEGLRRRRGNSSNIMAADSQSSIDSCVSTQFLLEPDSE